MQTTKILNLKIIVNFKKNYTLFIDIDTLKY